jgi:hypothetical protein
MSTMGKYCKAYPLNMVEEWPEWKSKMKPNVEIAHVNDGDTATDYVFIQENYQVTAGIFIDEDILFDDVTAEWREFCENHLKFQLPEAEQTAAEVS